MGDRYFLSIKCPRCRHTDDECYYALTCGFTTWECPNCKLGVDLAAYTGISYEDASNVSEIARLVEEIDGLEHDEGGEG